MKHIVVCLGLFAISASSAFALTPTELATFNAIMAKRALEVLGPAPTGYQGYKGNFTTKQPLPAGCTEKVVYDKQTNKNLVRVFCP
jgi:hypothetical protein